MMTALFALSQDPVTVSAAQIFIKSCASHSSLQLSPKQSSCPVSAICPGFQLL